MKWLIANRPGPVLARAAIAVLAALGVLDQAGQMAASSAVECVVGALHESR